MAARKLVSPINFDSLRKLLISTLEVIKARGGKFCQYRVDDFYLAEGQLIIPFRKNHSDTLEL